jgi:hypothetical protein
MRRGSKMARSKSGKWNFFVQNVILPLDMSLVSSIIGYKSNRLRKENEMISELVEFNTRLVNGDLPVRPGQEETISKAASVGDYCWQGDLKLTIINKITPGFVKTNPTELHKQVVPGNTKGSKHCLEHLDVEYYIPATWSHSEEYDGLFGPQILFKSDNCLKHEEHGNINISEGMMISFEYQKNLDIETKKEIRARD